MGGTLNFRLRDKIKLPCKDCICLPSCKRKPIGNIDRDCSIFSSFLKQLLEETRFDGDKKKLEVMLLLTKKFYKTFDKIVIPSLRERVHEHNVFLSELEEDEKGNLNRPRHEIEFAIQLYKRNGINLLKYSPMKKILKKHFKQRIGYWCDYHL